jgi:hypothetical protein
VGEQSKSLPGSSSPAPDVIEQLTTLQSTLDQINDDAQLLDANSQDIHEQVKQIREILKAKLFGVNGPRNPSIGEELYLSYKTACDAEYDQYNIYSATLDRYEKRRKRDLSVADVDEDTETLVQRRRKYIPKLRSFYSNAKAILDSLNEKSSPA